MYISKKRKTADDWFLYSFFKDSKAEGIGYYKTTNAGRKKEYKAFINVTEAQKIELKRLLPLVDTFEGRQFYQYMPNTYKQVFCIRVY